LAGVIGSPTIRKTAPVRSSPFSFANTLTRSALLAGASIKQLPLIRTVSAIQRATTSARSSGAGSGHGMGTPSARPAAITSCVARRYLKSEGASSPGITGENHRSGTRPQWAILRMLLIPPPSGRTPRHIAFGTSRTPWAS